MTKVRSRFRRTFSAAIAALLVAGVALTGASTEGALAAVAAVGPNVAVNTRLPGQVTHDFQSPSVAINPTNPDNLVVALRNDSPNFSCRAQYSIDGGRTWAPSVLPAPPAGTCWAPAVAFGENNRVYMATQNRPSNGGSTGILVYPSADGGKTFTTPSLIGGSDSYQAGIVVDNSPTSTRRGRIYVVWYGFVGLGQSLKFSYSDTQGTTWLPTPLQHNPMSESQINPTPVVSADGTFYVIYKDVNPFTCQGAYSITTDTVSQCPIRVLRAVYAVNQVTSFEGPFLVASATYKDTSAAESPGIAAAPNGHLWATWSSLSDPQAGGDIHPDTICAPNPDVFAARSTDRGATWTKVKLNNEPCLLGSDQQNPWISVAPNGRVDTIFYDTRNDPDHVLRDVYYSSSSGDLNFSAANRRVTDRSFDTGVMFTPKATLAYQSTNFDRNNGLASSNGMALAAWGDARNTGPASPSGSSNSSASDVFSARISTAPPVDPRPVTRVSGATIYATSAALSRQTFSYATTVTIASEKSFLEPLAAAPLARKARGPLLLTPTGGLTQEVEDEITRLQPQKAYVIGGNDLVGSAVETQLTAINPGIVITRLAGSNASATARMISQELGAPASHAAVVVSGEDFSEALTSGALAAFERIPILPVMKTSIPAETKQALNDAGITKTLVIGGTGSISAAVFDQLASDGRNPTRVAGSSLYDTSVKVADAAIAGSGGGIPVPSNATYVVTASQPGDALAAGPAVAYRGGLLLAGDGDSASAEFLRLHAADVDQVMFIGNCAGTTTVAGFASPPPGESCATFSETTTTTGAGSNTTTTVQAGSDGGGSGSGGSGGSGSSTGGSGSSTATQSTGQGPSPAGGYWLVASDGGIFAFGDAVFRGSTGALKLNKPIVGTAATRSGNGYWLVASDGGIFAFGDAVFRGSTGALKLNQPIVGMATTPSGKGYWLAASDGGVFAFGDAVFRGSTGALRLNKPIVGMAATRSGNGYWLVASDGGIFAFGDAVFRGSTGALKLNQPIVGMATTPSGNGYWLVASDGGIFAFGDAVFRGSTGAIKLNKPIVGLAATRSGNGYWLVASDGGIFAFGDAPFKGSTGALKLNQPIVGMADRRIP